jgi:hypothetical protein
MILVISADNTASTHQLSKTIKIKHKNTILHVDFCGCETWYTSIIEGRTNTEGIRENGAEKNIWTEGGYHSNSPQNTALCQPHNSKSSPHTIGKSSQGDQIVRK